VISAGQLAYAREQVGETLFDVGTILTRTNTTDGQEDLPPHGPALLQLIAGLTSQAGANKHREAGISRIKKQCLPCRITPLSPREAGSLMDRINTTW